MAARKISPKIRQKSKKSKSNNGLPAKVITLKCGDYECNIIQVSKQETKYGNSIVITLETKVIDSEINLYKYFNISHGIISGSELYSFLYSMDAISDDIILWSKLKGASVIATIEIGDDTKIKVKKLTPSNTSYIDESIENSDEYEEDDEEYEEDEEYDEEE